MKGLLLNVGIKNKGNEALVESTKKILNSFVPDLLFIQMGPEDQLNTNIYPQPSSNLISLDPWLSLIICMKIRIFRKLGMKVKISKESYLFIFDDVDIIINSGGDVLSGERIIVGGFLNLIYAILLNKPVVLIGESLGYYKYPWNGIIAKYVFKRVQLICVREALSKKYLLEIGVDKSRIHETADPAFVLSPASVSRVKEIMSLENIPSFVNPVIGINISGIISRYLDRNNPSDDQYISSMVYLINYLTVIKGFDVLLIPHVFTDKGDDRKVIQNVMKSISNKKKVFQITQEYSASELKGIIGLCEIFIGARMHATIAATSLCIPTIGIAYSHKMHGILGEALELNRYIIDIKKLNQKNLQAIFDEVYENRIALKAKLEMTIPKMKEKAYSNGFFFSKYLESVRQISDTR